MKHQLIPPFMLSGLSMTLKAGGLLAFLIIIGRFLPLEDFGLISFYLSIGTISSLLVDYGFQLKLVKDIAAETEKTSVLFMKSLSTKVAISGSILAIGLVVLLTNAVPADEQVIAGALVSALIIWSFQNHFAIPFRANQFYGRECILFCLCEIGMLAAILMYFFISKDPTPLGASITFLLARVMGLGLSGFLYGRYFQWPWPSHSVVTNLKTDFSYFLHFAIGTLYVVIDTPLIRILADEKFVGPYQIAMRAVLAMTLPTVLCNTILLPRLSAAFQKHGHQAVKPYREIRGFIILGIVAATSSYLIWPAIMHFGLISYSELINPLILPFSAVIVLRYWGSVYGTLLTVSKRQKWRVYSLALTLVFILIGDFTFIPVFGWQAAAWVQVGGHILLLGLYILFTKREFGSLYLWK